MSKIALIGERAFIVTSVMQAMEQAGHKVVHMLPNMKELNQLTQDINMVVIYGGDYIENANDALVYLRDYCVEHEIHVGLLGYEEEFILLEKTFPKEIIWKKFQRPFNAREFVEQLAEELEQQANEENKKHVMIIDDSGTMLRTVKNWISGKYKVTVASSAAMAISLLANTTPDLILLDYEMPVCNGPQFLEMIRAEMTTASIPVFFLTAKNDMESVKRAVTLKPEGYLLKSMSSTELIQTIDDFFEKRKAKL